MILFNGWYVRMNLLDAGGAGGGAGAGSTNASGAVGDAGNATPSGGNPGSTGGITWDAIKASLPEDLRSEGSLEPIKDVQTLVKNYIHAQKMVGKGNVPIPDAKHATQEDWLQIFRKLGAPDKMEEFKLKLPDGVKEEALDPAFMKSVKEAAMSVGVQPWQFEKIFNTYYTYADSKVKEGDQLYKTQSAEDVNSLKVAWGAAFDDQVKRANVALKELVPDVKDRERLVADGLGNHPVLLKALAAASKYFKEDTFLGHGEGTLTSMTPKDAEKRAREIMGDGGHPYRNPTHPNHKSAKKEVQDLWRVAYPE